MSCEYNRNSFQERHPRSKLLIKTVLILIVICVLIYLASRSKVVLWCETHQEFLSLLLTLTSIIIAVIAVFIAYYVGKIPYKNKLIADLNYQRNNNTNYLQTTIVNCGPAPAIIASVTVYPIDKKIAKEPPYQVQVMKTTSSEHFLFLEAGQEYMTETPVFGWNSFFEDNGADLNNKLKIIIHELGGRVKVIKNGYSVG